MARTPAVTRDDDETLEMRHSEQQRKMMRWGIVAVVVLIVLGIVGGVWYFMSNKASSTDASDCSNTGFFDCFDFFTSADPTNGQVTFVSQDTATSDGLISTSSTSAIMMIDSTSNLAAGANRNSVRLTSKKTMSLGSLVIGDFIRMPYGCAVWPVLTREATQEIDIVEGVNIQTNNQMTLHVKDDGCKMDSSAQTAGTASTVDTDCDANADGNGGCAYIDQSATSYGEGFNKQGGGVFAMSYTTDGISIWAWGRGSIPSNIDDGAPDMSTWGNPGGTWPSSTCANSYFTDQSIIFDMT
ncbi:glycoside hydrolase family 16 protein [Pseudohyphozyma bogoriensis]|nr:glycoside hydrolase family 16 protein [Pseudohyphozyma bogoriensis]